MLNMNMNNRYMQIIIFHTTFRNSAVFIAMRSAKVSISDYWGSVQAPTSPLSPQPRAPKVPSPTWHRSSKWPNGPWYRLGSSASQKSSTTRYASVPSPPRGSNRTHCQGLGDAIVPLFHSLSPFLESTIVKFWPSLQNVLLTFREF